MSDWVAAQTIATEHTYTIYRLTLTSTTSRCRLPLNDRRKIIRQVQEHTFG